MTRQPHWTLLDAENTERDRFADLAQTRALISDLAAPPNTHRRVHVIQTDDGLWFLKEFHRTQLKNRWRHRLTPPRCGTDAEREVKMQRELARRGVPHARAVAWGEDGPTSYVMFAALPGRSIHTALQTDPTMLRRLPRVARTLGALLGDGLRLPDLSAHDVFTTADEGQYAVIDLHNAGLGSTRPRAAVRTLRRIARSVRDLPIPRTAALGFAVRFLATAGFGRTARRRILRRVPPMETHGRYEIGARAQRYRHRNPKRTEAELALLRQVWPGREGEVVLDAPCGAGRLRRLITEEFGCPRIGADRAMAMLRQAREGGDAGTLLQADAAALPVIDRGVDGVVVFRFLHHLPPATAQAVVAEAGRVAGRFVVVSFFHPCSVHGFSRWLRGKLTGKAPTRFAVTHGRLVGWMREAGFEPGGKVAESAYRKDFWVAAFVRAGG